MLENYVDEYGTDPDYEVLVMEMPFQVIVPHRATGEPLFLYTGVIDRVWRLFFFQAEYGIRDLYVTGVQTCALPISQVVLGRVGNGLQQGEGHILPNDRGGL